jgi:SAM-dependent methyltransferase
VGPAWHDAPADRLAETRSSYDIVAHNDAELVRGRLPGLPVLRSVLVMFAELVRGDGPVLDLGCGPGQITALLQELGPDMIGTDLSPTVIQIARRDYAGPRYEVGSMTELTRYGQCAAGALLFWSLINVPDDCVGIVLAEVFRVLRPGGVVAIGFHVGDRVHRRPRATSACRGSSTSTCGRSTPSPRPCGTRDSLSRQLRCWIPISRCRAVS